MRRNTLIATLGTAMFVTMTLAFTATSAMAQRGFPSPHFAFRGYGSGTPFSRNGSSLYPFALPADTYYDAYYSGAFNAGYPVVSQPPIVILQGSSVAAPPPETHTVGDPVLIELRGDAYVRVSGPPVSGATTLNLQPSHPDVGAEHPSQPRAVLQTPVQPESVVLVFRDGHREDVFDYVIANGTLYAHTSLYTAGAWTKTIDLAALDLPGTISYNQTNGVRFQLPSAANEVMVGP